MFGKKMNLPLSRPEDINTRIIAFEDVDRLTRGEVLRTLELLYLYNLVEDPIDGTGFDMDVLDAIRDLKNKYGADERNSV